MKRLPKKFRGAEVVRGLGMDADKLDALVEKKSYDYFNAEDDMWVVVTDHALSHSGGSVTLRGFASKEDAVRYARACGNGNVDQRVLHVTDQVLVVATDNEL